MTTTKNGIISLNNTFIMLEIATLGLHDITFSKRNKVKTRILRMSTGVTHLIIRRFRRHVCMSNICCIIRLPPIMKRGRCNMKRGIPDADNGAYFRQAEWNKGKVWCHCMSESTRCYLHSLFLAFHGPSVTAAGISLYRDVRKMDDKFLLTRGLLKGRRYVCLVSILTSFRLTPTTKLFASLLVKVCAGFSHIVILH